MPASCRPVVSRFALIWRGIPLQRRHLIQTCAVLDITPAWATLLPGLRSFDQRRAAHLHAPRGRGRRIDRRILLSSQLFQMAMALVLAASTRAALGSRPSSSSPSPPGSCSPVGAHLPGRDHQPVPKERIANAVLNSLQFNLSRAIGRSWPPAPPTPGGWCFAGTRCRSSGHPRLWTIRFPPPPGGAGEPRQSLRPA